MRFAPFVGITRVRFKGFLPAKVSASHASAPVSRVSVGVPPGEVNGELGMRLGKDDEKTTKVADPFIGDYKKFHLLLKL